jgi:hypothetical protein
VPPPDDLPRRVVVLLHARDDRAEARPYILWALCERWRERGVEVVLARGPRAPREGDAWVHHVDLTVTPPAYRAALARAALAVNGRFLDASKRAVGGLVLRPGESWDGPVIVKTDANCGGKSEARFAGPFPAARLARAARLAAGAFGGRAGLSRARWRSTTRLETDAYPVFPSLAALPAGVLENPALVVERFLPEREGDLYALRTYHVLGDRSISRRVLSTDPIVKAGGVVRRDEVEPHPDVPRAARRLGLDYGKVDYVVHDGRAHVLDVNRTPTFGPRLNEEKRRWTADVLAPGLAALWAARSGAGGAAPPASREPEGR